MIKANREHLSSNLRLFSSGHFIVFSMLCFYGDSLCHLLLSNCLASFCLNDKQNLGLIINDKQSTWLTEPVKIQSLIRLRICAIAIEWSKCLTEMKRWHLCAVTECCIMKMRLAVSTP